MGQRLMTEMKVRLEAYWDINIKTGFEHVSQDLRYIGLISSNYDSLTMPIMANAENAKAYLL